MGSPRFTAGAVNLGFAKDSLSSILDNNGTLRAEQDKTCENR